MRWFGWTRKSDAHRIRHLEKRLDELQLHVQALKSRLDVPDAWTARFLEERATDAYQAVFRRREPLVSVCVATYHKPDLLIDRCLASLLEQTYKNLEIIVIGDCCTDETSERMAQIRDSRVRYENLPRRASYPEDRKHRWMVAGTPAMNRGLALAQGDFITHLDHDDRHAPDRVERLVEFIQKTRADLVYHPFHYQQQSGAWRVKQAEAFVVTQVTTSSVFYHHWLKRIRWDPFSYRLEESGDWGRFRRMRSLGAHIERLPEPLLWHYIEQTGS